MKMLDFCATTFFFSKINATFLDVWMILIELFDISVKFWFQNFPRTNFSRYGGLYVLGHPVPRQLRVQFLCHCCQKQVGGVGSGCNKTYRPLFLSKGSFLGLHGWNQLEKLVKMVYNMTYLHKNWLICRLRGACCCWTKLSSKGFSNCGLIWTL